MPRFASPQPLNERLAAGVVHACSAEAGGEPPPAIAVSSANAIPASHRPIWISLEAARLDGAGPSPVGRRHYPNVIGYSIVMKTARRAGRLAAVTGIGKPTRTGGDVRHRQTGADRLDFGRAPI